MIEKYIALNRALRTLNVTTREIIDEIHYQYTYNNEEDSATHSLSRIVYRQFDDLKRIWPTELENVQVEEIGRLLSINDSPSYQTLVNKVLPNIEQAIDNYFSTQHNSDLSVTILDLLHPRVASSSYSHFKSGRYREAVLNSIITLFDLIRERTGIDKDGSDLVSEAFSLSNPYLVFSTLDDDSGCNDQKGFIQILKGIFQGVRNPKAHTLTINPSKEVAAQYLVFSSLLCRRVEEAQKVGHKE